jgi:predicted GNAT superfamily acetyltransferase
MTDKSDQFELREISTFRDIDACIALQRKTWRMADADMTPSRLFVVARYAGVPPVGAFHRDGSLLGFVFTLPARFEGTQAYYSHMLAVEEEWRDQGVGYRLKLAQRERAIADGVPLVVWTYDPLQSRNAHFNLNKLGVVVRRYVVNFYGEHHNTAFDSGIGSDRVFAEWWVRSPKVRLALHGERFQPALTAPAMEIPADIAAVRRKGGDQAALLWRLHTRERFQSRLSRGLVAVALEHDPEAATSRYVFADAREVDGAGR